MRLPTLKQKATLTSSKVRIAAFPSSTQPSHPLHTGSTVYVTLEPCHHTGRTPPCDKELVKNEVARVVVRI